VPSALDPKTFSCYTPLQQGWIIFGYVVSAISSIFSLYKLRVFVKERMHTLKEAGINLTVKNFVFLDRALANRNEKMLVSLAESPNDVTLPQSQVEEMMRNFEMQLSEQQKLIQHLTLQIQSQKQ
jgi:hypothetical protein